ncbi:MAG: ArsR family transcriptional regulator [Nitrospirota bacterium]|nr:ArsR family transcriptional regulator [Nitrospirota bacterium]
MAPKNSPKKPFVPADRRETVRQKIISALEGQTLSAREISAAVSVSEKEVYEHLFHIQKTLHKRGGLLSVTPPECRKCGFRFTKRERLSRPGKCPVCRAESVTEPFFSVQ